MPNKPEEKRVCSGNLDDGVDIDLVQYAGLTSFTPEQYDQLTDATHNDMQLLERCGEHYYLILMDNEGNEQTLETENMDERSFFLYTDDEAAFKLELRKQILMAIGAS